MAEAVESTAGLIGGGHTRGDNSADRNRVRVHLQTLVGRRLHRDTGLRELLAGIAGQQKVYRDQAPNSRLSLALFAVRPGLEPPFTAERLKALGPP
jgi:hypothetical protein